MLDCIFRESAEELLRLSPENLNGYIASEETIDYFCEMFIRLRPKYQPADTKVTGGYKAYVLAQI
ncbi:MAG: hypothetical protein ACM3NT_04385 [Methylocystaceae bacterium]